MKGHASHALAEMHISVAPLLRAPMGTHEDHEFAEDPIDPRGENASLDGAGFTSFDARARATHTDLGALLEGDVRARLAQQCSRCLRPITSEVETEFGEQYYATIGVTSGESLPEAPPDARTIGSDFKVDLAPLLLEELLLVVPQAPLCRPDCRGLCSECGADLNERPHEHERPADDRWAKLRDLHPDGGENGGDRPLPR